MEMQTEMETKMEQQRAEMDRQRAEMEAKLMPKPVVSSQQLEELQCRLETLHAAQLLSADELYTLEDMVADYVELESRAAAAITLEVVHTNENASKLLTLIALSERLAADGAFLRQLRRKYL